MKYFVPHKIKRVGENKDTFFMPIKMEVTKERTEYKSIAMFNNSPWLLGVPLWPSDIIDEINIDKWFSIFPKKTFFDIIFSINLSDREFGPLS